MLFFILLLLVIVPITNFFHELGHIVIARLLKINGTIIELGVGPKLLSFHLFGSYYQINAVYFLGALSTNNSYQVISNWQKGLISLGGPFVNILLAIFLVLFEWQENSFFGLFIMFNFWVGFVNLIPFRFFKKESDGYVFLSSIIKEIKMLRTK